MIVGGLPVSLIVLLYCHLCHRQIYTYFVYFVAVPNICIIVGLNLYILRQIVFRFAIWCTKLQRPFLPQGKLGNCLELQASMGPLRDKPYNMQS